MRLSFFATALLSATAAVAAPSAQPEAADLLARSPNALPLAAPAALPIAKAAAAPLPAELDPLLNALIQRSLEERQFDFSSITNLISDLGPIIQAVLSLINSEVINSIRELLENASIILDTETANIARNLLLTLGAILTPELSAAIVPVLQDLGPIITGVVQLLSSILGIFFGEG